MMNAYMKTTVISLMLLILAACSSEQPGVNVNKMAGHNEAELKGISGLKSEYEVDLVELGRELYGAQCMSCHGTKESQGPYGPYFIDGSSLTSAQEYVEYVTNLMPISQPHVCAENCSDAVFAYAVTEFLETKNDLDDSNDGDLADDDNSDNLNNDNTNNSADDNNRADDTNNDNQQNIIQGKTLYTEQCAACHGDDGEGGNFPAFFVANSNVKTDQTMVSYIVENMPLGGVENCNEDCSQKILNYAKENFKNYYGVNDGNVNTDPNDGSDTDTGSQAPNAPSDIIASLSASQEMINVFWNDNSANEEGFLLQRKMNLANWETIALTAVNANIYVDTNISAGNAYRYKVRSFNGSLNSVYVSSLEVSVEQAVIKTKPLAPSHLVAKLNTGIMVLSWQDNSDNENGFTLERRIQSGIWQQLAELAMNNIQYSNRLLEAGKIYEYRLTAFNEVGHSNSVSMVAEKIPNETVEDNTDTECIGEPQYVAGTAYSIGQKVINEGFIFECSVPGWCSSASALHYAPETGINWPDAWVKISAASCDNGSDNPTIPAEVNNLNTTINAGMTSINVSWLDISDDESGFLIERKRNDENWMAMAELSAETQNFVDASIQAGNDYQYRVATFNRAGTSAWVTGSRITLLQTQTIPTLASDVKAALSSDKTRIDVSWSDNSDNETGFKVERRVNSGSWQLQSSKAKNTSNYSDNLVSAGSAYEYRVAPFNVTGTASYVQSALITISAANNKSEGQLAYENNCTGCHSASGGIGGNLLDARISSKWQAKSSDDFLTKVHSMQTSQCNEACQTGVADYLWLSAWGLEKEIIVVTNGRGVRGIRLLSPSEYQNTIYNLTGVELLAAELPSQYFDTEFKYPTQGDTGIVLYEGMKKYLALAEKVSKNASLSRLGCNSGGCSNNQITTLGLKVFRRPLSAQEKTTYVNLKNSDGSRGMLTSMLMSPYFLYKMELGTWNESENAYELNDYEMASSLAFMVWGTAPDQTLLTLAANGGLSSNEQIGALLESMMNDARFAKNMSNFIKYYSHSYQEATEKPGLNTAVIDAMYAEQDGFIDYWLNSDDASFYKLFNPGYTFVNATLANHYGINDSQSTLHKINTSRNRGGLLHQGLTQIMNSDFSATSLVKRGKMIRENMLCHTMGVPSGVDPSTLALPTTPMTTRERWDLVNGPEASGGQCWECHQLMNEPGSSLEQFDAAGRYRTKEKDYNGSNIDLILDVTGTLRDNSANPLMQYADARELTEYLGGSNEAKSCFADSYLRYATGHKSDGYNKEELTGLQAKFDQNDNVKLMVKWLAQSAMMRFRVER